MNKYVKKNMMSYKKKGLLDIVDRDNNYQSCTDCITSRAKKSLPGCAHHHKSALISPAAGASSQRPRSAMRQNFNS